MQDRGERGEGSRAFIGVKAVSKFRRGNSRILKKGNKPSFFPSANPTEKMAVVRNPFSSRSPSLSPHISHKPLGADPLAETCPAGLRSLRRRNLSSLALPGLRGAGRRGLPSFRRRVASGLERRVRAASAAVGQSGVPRPSEGRAAAWRWVYAEPGDSREPSGPGPERVCSGGPRPPARGAGAPTAVAGAAAGGGGGQDNVGPPLRRWRRGLRGRGGRGRGAGRPRAIRSVPQRGRGASQEAGDARESEQPRHGGQEIHPAPLRRR